MRMAFLPPVMFARSLNVISRPRSKANRRVLPSKRGAACSPNTGRLHRQKKSTPTAPICSRTSVNIFDDRGRCRGDCAFRDPQLLRSAEKNRTHHGFNPGGHLLGGDTVG